VVGGWRLAVGRSPTCQPKEKRRLMTDNCQLQTINRNPPTANGQPPTVIG